MNLGHILLPRERERKKQRERQSMTKTVDDRVTEHPPNENGEQNWNSNSDPREDERAQKGNKTSLIAF